MADPIWLDVAASIADGKYFRISGGQDADGNTGVFYQGKAVTPTGTGNATVYYNRICAPRLVYGQPSFTARTKTACCIPQTFTIQTSSDGTTWSTLTTKSFMPDWSYIGNQSTYRGAPINDHFHPSMCLFYSAQTSQYLSLWYDRGSGHQNQGNISIAATGGTASFPLALLGYSDLIGAGFGALKSWETPVYCAPGALYYRNAFGGWDSLLIEGSLREIIDATHYTRKVFINNSLSPYRGEYNYVSEITPRWTVSTHGMTDDESALMWHLLESPDVWLHDFAKGTYRPVILDDGGQEIRTYRNNGRKLSVYTLSMRLAQERIIQ